MLTTGKCGGTLLSSSARAARLASTAFAFFSLVSDILGGAPWTALLVSGTVVCCCSKVPYGQTWVTSAMARSNVNCKPILLYCHADVRSVVSRKTTKEPALGDHKIGRAELTNMLC